MANGTKAKPKSPSSKATAPQKAASEAPDGTAKVASMPGRLLTRLQAARVVGVGKTTIRRAEEDGELPVAQIGPSGEHLFDERELRRFALRYQQRQKGRSRRDDDVESAHGEIAAQMFERFDKGDNPVDVVKALSFDPDLVEKRHAQWARMRGLLVLPPERVDKFVDEMKQLFKVPAPVPPIRSAEAFKQWAWEVADRAGRLEARASKPCQRCQRAAPTTCDACARDQKLDQRMQLEEMKLDRAATKELERKRARVFGADEESSR